MRAHADTSALTLCASLCSYRVPAEAEPQRCCLGDLWASPWQPHSAGKMRFVLLKLPLFFQNTLMFLVWDELEINIGYEDHNINNVIHKRWNVIINMSLPLLFREAKKTKQKMSVWTDLSLKFFDKTLYFLKASGIFSFFLTHFTLSSSHVVMIIFMR